MKTLKGKPGWMVVVLALLLGTVKPAAAQNNLLMSDDFKSMMDWLSLELAQGLAFNAGSTFDPPGEIEGYRLAPDISLGIGSVPLDKKKFPEPKTQALKDRGISSIFPKKVLFPNLTMHLRAALPKRHDFSIRVTNMTTPPNYKISPDTTGSGQSNSIGFGLRRHFFGGDKPRLTVGANFNHIVGKFELKTKFGVAVQGYSADSDVSGVFEWNINSYGLNTVISQKFGIWTPFAGLGYNYATGSVRTRLVVITQGVGVDPVIGEASNHPESSSGRMILGTQVDTKWGNWFANTEMKVGGEHAGESWIVHMGVMLPFRIGPKKNIFGIKGKTGKRERAVEQPRRRGKPRTSPPVQVKPVHMDDPDENISDLIFIE